MDIKNAFNALNWGKILMEAEARGMFRKLLTPFGNYLENRKIVIVLLVLLVIIVGIFNVYRKTINKEDHSKCWDCDTDDDDAEHALFHCPRWIYERTEFESYIGMPLTVENLIEGITKKEDNWIRFQAFSRKIMQERLVQEKIVERKKRQASRLN